MNSDICSFIDSRSRETIDLLSALIRFRSTAGNEQPVQEYLARHIADLGFDPRLVPIHPNIEADEDYTTVPGHKGYEGRTNLVFTVPGTGGGRSIILNSHVDTIPAPDELLQPKVNGDVVHGRGACDAKGQVLVILLALSALKEAGVRLKGDVMAQFVIEEEPGGNGSLSVILDGMRADGVVVIESTNFKVYTANRGALWFKLGIEGKSVHMGRWRDGVSALDEMIAAIRIFKDYEQTLLAESSGDPLFPDPSASVIVNVGMIHGGDWPSAVPGYCEIEGGVGFLPNKRLSDIREELRREIEEHASRWTHEHYSLEYSRLHNEAYRIPHDHPLAQTLWGSVASLGMQSEVTSWSASCDARLFHHRGGMPVVVFGPGSVSHAHSDEEQISIKDLNLGARILADFLIRWCGT